jgi:hypothetical protein
MSKIQLIVGLLLFLIVLFSMNIIFGNILRESFTTNVKMSSPSKSTLSAPPKNNNKIYSRLSTQNQNDDQPLFFGFS